MAATNDDLLPWPPTQGRRVRRWRVTSSLGGVLLFVTFFMPAVEGCNSPISPAEVLLEAATARQETAWDVVGLVAFFAMCGAPYLFGLLVAVISLREALFPYRSRVRTGGSIAALGGALTIWAPIFLVWVLLNEGLPGSWLTWLWPTTFLSIFALLSPIYLIRAIRHGAGGMLCLRWYAALWALAWFSLCLLPRLVRHEGTYYGLWLSIVASLVIVVAAHAEAHIRIQEGWFATLVHLLRCRLPRYDLNGPRCFTCGYLLVSLPENRCPECGREFDPQDYPMLTLNRTSPHM